MCSGCVQLGGAALDRYAAALQELATRRHGWTRAEVAVKYDVPLQLLPEQEGADRA